ncbi:MAG: glutamine synthetase family protein [Oscillospiraceae bacterium]|jgi:glutamine synthetase
MYSREDVMTYVREEDVRFIRLSFCDPSGKQKNVAVMADQLETAFSTGISLDGSAVEGFGDAANSELLLVPDPSTLAVVPWRSQNGKVISMFCDLKKPDGSECADDPRFILRTAAEKAASMGISCNIGPEFEFYLFKRDADGSPTDIPMDTAGYMDMAPEDAGEDVRREICQVLFQMGIKPERTHHEEGPGQNEIDFRYGAPLQAADNATIFKWVVRTVSKTYGLYADFSPKPIRGRPGSGFHINISASDRDGNDVILPFMAGIMDHITEMTAFLNPSDESYMRLGEYKAPKYVSWSQGNRSQLIRVPFSKSPMQRIELRSPDPLANPYIAFALIIHAGLDGLERGLEPDKAENTNLFDPNTDIPEGLIQLPRSFEEAKKLAFHSSFVRSILPDSYFGI